MNRLCTTTSLNTQTGVWFAIQVAHMDIDSYASSVLDYINTNINSVPHHQMDYSILKSEAVDEVWLLLKAHERSEGLSGLT